MHIENNVALLLIYAYYLSVFFFILKGFFMVKITTYIHAAAIMILMGNVNSVCMVPTPDGNKQCDHKSMVLGGAVKHVASNVYSGVQSVSNIFYNKNDGCNYIQSLMCFSAATLLFPVAPPVSLCFAAIPIVEHIKSKHTPRRVPGELFDGFPFFPNADFASSSAPMHQAPTRGDTHPSADCASQETATDIEDAQEEVKEEGREGAREVGHDQGRDQEAAGSGNSTREAKKHNSRKIPSFDTPPNMGADQDYPWAPTISAAVTVAIGTLLVKKIFGQQEKEQEEKGSMVSEDIDDEEYTS